MCPHLVKDWHPEHTQGPQNSTTRKQDTDSKCVKDPSRPATKDTPSTRAARTRPVSLGHCRWALQGGAATLAGPHATRGAGSQSSRLTGAQNGAGTSSRAHSPSAGINQASTSRREDKPPRWFLEQKDRSAEGDGL